MAGQTSPWFEELTPHKPSRLRLFCLPFVGAGPAAFRAWPGQLPVEVSVYGAALPGRGRRIQEPPLSNLIHLVDELEAAIQPFLDRPYALFGHSFGALVGFELAHRLHRRAVPPVLLCVSGAPPPQLPQGESNYHTLSDKELVEVVRRLGGTPEAVLESEALVAALLPAIRADFAALETYVYRPTGPVDFPILGLGGAEDPQVGRQALVAWGEHTRAGFDLRMFPGGHFFIHQLEAEVMEVLGSALTQAGMADGPLDQ